MDIFKRLLSVVLGLGVAMILALGCEWVGQFIYKAPAGIDFNNTDAVAQMMSNMPLTAFAWLLFGYVLCSFAGGIVATLVAGRANNKPAIMVGTLLTIFGVMNLMSIPHPLWFAIVSTLVYIPSAMIGCMLVMKKPDAV